MRKCKICKEQFDPIRPLQSACSLLCAVKSAKRKAIIKKTKEDREASKKKKEGLEKLKTLSQHIKEAQIIFNKYIRLRDKDKPCISCQNNKGHEQAGHYYSVGGHPELRFNENNVFGQCVFCNLYKHGNLIEYSYGILERIGHSKLEQLKKLTNTPIKYTIPEIIELKEHYKNKIKCLE